MENDWSDAGTMNGIRLILAGMSAVVLTAPVVHAEEANVQPDILFIMPDQMRGDCLSILNHPVVETPCLDALAKQGTLFRRAYTTVSSCVPARYALLTGLYPQTSGVVGFKAKPITAATPPFPKLLAEAGYATVLAGRTMHQLPESGDCGYQQRILGSTYVNDDEYDRFLRKVAPETGGIKDLVKTMGLSYNYWEAKPWPLDDSLHPTTWAMERAKDVVKSTPLERPLFLTASFYAPHPPLFPPKRYFDKYLGMTLPETAKGDWVKWDAVNKPGKAGPKGNRVLLEGDLLNAAMAGYFGLIEQIDTEMGALIEEFKTRSEKAGRPWVVVFSSDHGEMLGDHGYFRKCEPFEGSANIPLIFVGSPSLGFKPNQVNDQPTCLEDIMPTLLALAGASSPGRMDGVNLVPTLRGEQQAIRKWLHFEHATCYSKHQAYHALTDGRYKYIWRPATGQELLFDLTRDLREDRDLANNIEYAALLKHWRAIMVERLADRPEGFSVDGKLVPGRPYRPLNQGFLDSSTRSGPYDDF